MINIIEIIKREIVSRFIVFFRISDEENLIIRNEIAWDNIRRVFYLSLIAIPASILQVIIFALKYSSSTGIERRWREMILTTHITLIVLFVSIAVVLYFSSIKPLKKNKIGQICVYLTILVLMIGGTIVTIFDQMVTPAITPFIITTIISGLILLIPPVRSVILFTITGLIFVFGIQFADINEEIVISDQANGITITFIGLFLSFILYKGFITRNLQQRLILKQNQKLLESNATKDKFFSIIAHDLRSPFQTILGFSQVLAGNLRKGDYASAEKYAVIVKESAENAYKLLENLLEWSMSETGGMKFNPESLNLSGVIRERLEILMPVAQAKNITLINEVPETLMACADRNMLMTIFRNLLANAVKFTRSGGMVKVSIKEMDNLLEITVADNGIGISENDIKDLFQPGSKISRKGTANEKGTGLGLVLCKEFVELHGGKIWVESEQDKGSRFIFTIPACNN